MPRQILYTPRKVFNQSFLHSQQLCAGCKPTSMLGISLVTLTPLYRPVLYGSKARNTSPESMLSAAATEALRS